jgi:glycosyltransferase involved in cell wall biosynthesis
MKVLSVIIPCFNEERTLRRCVEKVLEIADEDLSLEIFIVDDASSDGSLLIARELENEHKKLMVLAHARNQGKGAALRTGFERATGDFVAVQDADLEYRPTELKKLLEPLIADEADVVFGSRFLSPGAHRVLYFWHSLGNKFLTFVSNMFTDLNLTDMETCYKVFKREVIQAIDLKEDRFGFEPEIVAKLAHMRLRIFEVGVSYYGRTYAQGKKIGAKDGFRALYCILRYNAHRAPLPMQFILYLFIGGVAALANLLVFLTFLSFDIGVTVSALSAFGIAAALNYLLCILVLFRHKARWASVAEIAIYILVVVGVSLLDLWTTKSLLAAGVSPAFSKSTATIIGLALNFIGRRFMVFPEPATGSWKA